MQLQRLFEIVYLLIYKKHTTARDLANRFEVSTRTIYRDIETLCAAGIPIYTNKGKEGGIFMMDHFILNRSLLNENEQREILAALQGYQRLDKSGNENDTLHRLQTFFQQPEEPWIEIDLSDWSDTRRFAFQDIQQAIWNHQKLTFTYYASNGKQSQRSVHPLQLWFKDHAWYIRAYCEDKADIRTFKTTRMEDVVRTSHHFEPKQIPPITPMTQTKTPVAFVLRIQPEMVYRVYDEFENYQIEKQEDGSFLVHASYILDQWVIGNLMSYGAALEIIEPLYIKETLCKQLRDTLAVYAEKR